MWPRCKKCSICRSCGDYKDLRSFHQDERECSKCSKLGSSIRCEVCDRTQKADQFKQRKRRPSEKESKAHMVCIACENLGYSSRDVRKYLCYGCGLQGHKRFHTYQLSHHRLRGSEILCIECTRRESTISEILRSHDSHRCTCAGSKNGRKARHLPWNTRCELYAENKETKWPGKNEGLTLEDFLFHEHVLTRRRPLKRKRECTCSWSLVARYTTKMQLKRKNWRKPWRVQMLNNCRIYYAHDYRSFKKKSPDHRPNGCIEREQDTMTHLYIWSKHWRRVANKVFLKTSA